MPIGPLLLVLFAAGPTVVPQAKKPSPAELDKALQRLFDGPEEERERILASIDDSENLTDAAVKAWTKKLVAFAQRGPKLPDERRGYLYDVRSKRGLYILGGKSPGNGALFFGLHGGGVGQGDAEAAAAPWNGAVSGEGWAAVYPEVLEKTEAAWGDEGTERFVLDLLETLKRTRKIDTNRIFLGGHSMGGYGAWTIGGRHADLFAGLVALSGAPTPYRVKGDPKSIEGIEEGILPNLRNVPIYVYHSRDDPQVDFPANEFAVRELSKLRAAHGGYAFRFDAVDGRGHAFPDLKPGLDFIRKHVRDPRPKKFVWQPHWKWKRTFYWIRWDDPDPSVTLTAEITAPNRVEIRSQGAPAGVNGLTVLLDARMGDLEAPWTVVLDGKAVGPAPVRRSLRVLARTAAERRDPEMIFCSEIPL